VKKREAEGKGKRGEGSKREGGREMETERGEREGGRGRRKGLTEGQSQVQDGSCRPPGWRRWWCSFSLKVDSSTIPSSMRDFSSQFVFFS
jgi:hypothetical protein